MKLYPFDNLPVVVVQLQSERKKRAKKMEETIRNILIKYLEPKIAEKIEIKSILSRDSDDDEILVKAYGIPELLRISFDIMGRSISSATCLKISEDIKKLCKDFMDKKILYVQNLFKDEMEILEVAKNLFEKDLEDEDDDNDNKEEIKELSENNAYGNIENQNYFVDNFIKIISDKFIDIFNYLENGDNPLAQKENENINENNHPENNLEEQNELENNNINGNNIDENNNNQQNMNEEESEENEEENEENNEENKQENQIQNENINLQEINEEQNRQEDEIQNENEVRNKPAIVSLIDKKFGIIRKILDENFNKSFEIIFEKRFDIYLKELFDEQTEKNREFKDNTQLINRHEVEKNFKERLLPYFKNEFFKIFICIILKLFMKNFQKSLDEIVKKELDENENLINQKAENSLKNITEILKMNLIQELDNLMNEQK